MCWSEDLKKVRSWTATLKSSCVAGQYNEWLDVYENKLKECRQATATHKPPDNYEAEQKREELAQAAWEARHPIPVPPDPEPCEQQ